MRLVPWAAAVLLGAGWSLAAVVPMWRYTHAGDFMGSVVSCVGGDESTYPPCGMPDPDTWPGIFLDPFRHGLLVILAALLSVALVRSGRPVSGLLIAALWAAMPPFVAGFADEPFPSWMSADYAAGTWREWWGQATAWLQVAYLVTPPALALVGTDRALRTRLWAPFCAVPALTVPLVWAVHGVAYDPLDPWTFTWSMQTALLVYGTGLLVASSRHRLVAPAWLALAVLAFHLANGLFLRLSVPLPPRSGLARLDYLLDPGYFLDQLAPVALGPLVVLLALAAARWFPRPGTVPPVSEA